MKSIPNVQFSVKALASDPLGYTTATLIKECLLQAPQTGFDFAAMRARNKVADMVS